MATIFTVAEPKEEPVHTQPFSDAKMPTQEVLPPQAAAPAEQQPAPQPSY